MTPSALRTIVDSLDKHVDKAGSLLPVWNYIDENIDHLTERLGEAVAIDGVSPDPEKRETLIKTADWVAAQFDKLGFETKVNKLDTRQHLPDGTTLEIPPIVTCYKGNDPNKNNILLYCHYDVMPALLSDGWNSEPFKMVLSGSELRGRGTSDDKGPLIGWMNVFEAYLKTGTELPVNVRCVFEGMEEIGSSGFAEFLAKEVAAGNKVFQDIHAMNITDVTWFSKDKPAIGYSVRGIQHCWVEIQCAGSDLHSGIHGGVVHEAMPDVMYMLNSLVDVNGNPMIEGIQDEVRPLSEKESKAWEEIDFSPEGRVETIGAKKLTTGDCKMAALKNLWGKPCLSIHGLEGAFHQTGCKTVIPCKVIGKFSVRLCAGMTPVKTQEALRKHLEAQWAARGSPNKCEIKFPVCGKSWLSDPFGGNFNAASRALERIYNMTPDRVRDSASIPTTLTMTDALDCPLVLFCFGSSSDRAHSQNEKLDVRNWVNGMKSQAAYLDEVAKEKF